MTTRVELPGDQWAEIIDPMTVTEKQRRPLKAAYARFGLSVQRQRQAAEGSTDVDVDDLVDTTESFERECLCFCVAKWSFDAPVTPAALDDLPVPTFHALSEACGPMLEVLFPTPKLNASR